MAHPAIHVRDAIRSLAQAMIRIEDEKTIKQLEHIRKELRQIAYDMEQNLRRRGKEK